MVDYFTVLGVKRNASDQEIKEAYRRLAKQYHPDSNPGDADAARKMQEINEAKAILFDPVRREEHRVELSLRENISTSHIEELRRDPRFRTTSTYRPPKSRMPRSKWDKIWRKYFIGIVATVTVAAIGTIIYEIASKPKGTGDPIKDIISRYHQNDRLLVEDSLAAVPDTLTFPDDSAPKLRRMGDILFSLGEYRSAAKYYEMYLRKAPANDTVIGNLSYAYFKRGRYAQTLEMLSHEMHGDSNLVVAYYNIGELFLREAKPFDARDAFLASIRVADSMSLQGRHPPDAAQRARNELKHLQ